MSKTLLLREPQNTNQIHIVLRERLRESLATQSPGKRLSSERILAKEFGVSTATVSRALQDLQQEGILRRIPGKGTFLTLSPEAAPAESWDQDKNSFSDGTGEDVGRANSHARIGGKGLLAAGFSMPSKERHQVAHEAAVNALIIVQLQSYETSIDRSSEFWPQRIVSQLEYLIAGQGGKTKITLGSALNEEQCIQAWRSAVEEDVNCVFFIVDERNPLVDVWVEQLVASHVGLNAGDSSKRAPAVVQISLAATRQSYFDTVSYDGEWGAYLATLHLLQLGHREIAFLAPSSDFAWVDHRILGFHRALRTFGIAFPRDESEFGVIRTEEVLDGPQMWQQLGINAADQVATNDSITAVLTTNDQMASGFIERSRELGRAIPESLSVVGYDDWFTSAINGLTTVHPPIDEIADAALQLAKKQATTGLREHVHLFLKPTLMVRTTTQALPAKSKPQDFISAEAANSMN